MPITKYRAFINVVEQGSITKAANLMDYTQPGISKMIDSLEDSLNVKLFTRTNSTITPTENGKQLYIYCKKIVQDEDQLLDAVDAINGLITGNIHIGALNSIIIDYVPNLIQKISTLFPIIQMQLNELSFTAILEQLKKNTIDVGFTSEFNISGVDFIPLFNDPIRLIVNKDHFLADRGTIPIDILSTCEFINIPSIGDDLIKVVMGIKKFTPIVHYYVHSDAASISMVKKNLGVYIISELQCYNLPNNVVKLEFEENPYRTIGIGINHQNKDNNLIKELIRTSKEVVKDMNLIKI